MTTVIRYLRPPPLPDVPEPLRDVPLLTIDGAYVGDPEAGEALFAPLRALGEPIMDNFARMPAAGLSRIHMDPEPPVPGMGHHTLVSELPDEAIDAFIGMAGPDSGSPLLLAELRQLRGAIGRPAEGAGALSHLDADYAMFAVGMPMTPELGQAIERRHDELVAALSPWDGGAYFNFAERPADLEAILDGGTCERLAEVKRRWDPEGLIRANHALALDPA